MGFKGEFKGEYELYDLKIKAGYEIRMYSNTKPLEQRAWHKISQNQRKDMFRYELVDFLKHNFQDLWLLEIKEFDTKGFCTGLEKWRI